MYILVDFFCVDIGMDSCDSHNGSRFHCGIKSLTPYTCVVGQYDNRWHLHR